MDVLCRYGAKNHIVGVIIVRNDGRRGYIYHTAVNPKYRKQGIAKNFLDAAMAALQEYIS